MKTETVSFANRYQGDANRNRLSSTLLFTIILAISEQPVSPGDSAAVGHWSSRSYYDEITQAKPEAPSKYLSSVDWLDRSMCAPIFI